MISMEASGTSRLERQHPTFQACSGRWAVIPTVPVALRDDWKLWQGPAVLFDVSLSLDALVALVTVSAPSEARHCSYTRY